MNAPVIEKRFRDPNPVARLNRELLQRAGVFTVSVIGGPGCGKTTLLDATIELLMPEVHVGVIACDFASHRDADRMSQHSEQVVQVNIGPGGTLDATHIRDALKWLDPKWLDLLLIENVGTLTVSTAPNLGQDVTATIFSVAGGDDKVEKHPDLVTTADVVILNKTDLLASVPFDLTAFRSDVKNHNPTAELFEISALHRTGLCSWLKWLQEQVRTPQHCASEWFG